jgi:hypothetical protein
VNDLSDLDLENLPTTGVVILQFEVESWTEVGEALASSAVFDYPKRKV